MSKRLGLPWRVSLAARILAVNIIALGLLAGSLFYLDSYRNELVSERFQLARAEVEIAANALEASQAKNRPELMTQIASEQSLRLRLYDAEGELLADTFTLAEPTFAIIDPASEPWHQYAARILDMGMDWMLSTPPIPPYHDPEEPDAGQWDEIAEAVESGATVVSQRLAPDRTPVITGASPVGEEGVMLLTTRNARDLTQNIRDARQTLAIIVGTALFISILLSLFLARTIVQPLRKLVRAAVRVRLGRDREVVVPRLPDRRDEIGLLARAISDMTAALRHRIDSVESFAADVAHELKNPLTSMRSALESLEKVDDPELRLKLTAIAKQDVLRVDRLVTEIADASRIDAQLSRTTFEPVDMSRLITALIAERAQRDVNGGCQISVEHSGSDFVAAGDAHRLERVLQNLLDNAVSFSPIGGAIDIDLTSQDWNVEIAICDLGPGIPSQARHKVFERFHSLRPTAEEFGKHSGLGLAIARTIIEAHFGTLDADDRTDGKQGARLIIRLPRWEAE